jgi:hypothetical protein
MTIYLPMVALILKSLRRTEVTNLYDIINYTPERSIIFMPNIEMEKMKTRKPTGKQFFGAAGIVQN